MKHTLCLIACLLGWVSSAQADWFCTEASSERRGNEILACGVAKGADENESRLRAFDNAMSEFKKVCGSECTARTITTTPKRTECTVQGSDYKCYRLVVFAIGDLPSAPTTANGIVGAPAAITIDPPALEGSSTRVHNGMTKKEFLAAFGEPNWIHKDEFSHSLSLVYSGRLCSSMSCGVTFKNNVVTSFDNFKPEYSDDLQ